MTYVNFVSRRLATCPRYSSGTGGQCSSPVQSNRPEVFQGSKQYELGRSVHHFSAKRKIFAQLFTLVPEIRPLTRRRKASGNKMTAQTESSFRCAARPYWLQIHTHRRQN